MGFTSFSCPVPEGANMLELAAGLFVVWIVVKFIRWVLYEAPL